MNTINRKIIANWMLLLAIFLLYPLSSNAASELEITAKQRVLIAQERGIVTLPFNIINHGNKTRHLVEKIDLPHGWRQLSAGSLFSLKAGEKTLRLVHLLASSEVESGRYEITYHINAQNGKRRFTTEKVTVVIKSNAQLALDVIDAPSLVLAGEAYQIKLRIKNKGNIPLSLNLNASDQPHYLRSFSPKKLTLPPATSSTIILNATIPREIENTTSHIIKLSLRGNSLSFNKTIRTQIISRIPLGLGQYHKLQTVTTFNYTKNGKSNTLQTELKAFGGLDLAGKHYIDLLLRNKKDNDTSTLISSSEQRLSYKNATFDLHLGDRTFSVGGISDAGLYGQGVEIHLHPSQQSWSLRTFSVREQPKDSTNNKAKKTSKGTEISYYFANDLELSANFLLKADENNSQYNEKIWGVNANWYKDDTLNINVSYAKDNDGNAYRLQQDGRISNTLRYNLEIQRASAKFDGEIKDKQHENITAIYTFDDSKKYIRTSLYHQQKNLDKDRKRQILDEKEARFGLGYYFAGNHHESLYAEMFTENKEDKRKPSNLKKKTTGLRLDYKKYLSNQWAVNNSISYQHINNQLKQEQSTQTSESLTLAYTPNDQYQMAFNIDAMQFSNKHNDNLNYGLNASLNMTSQQRLSGYWRHSNSMTTDSDIIQANYSYQFQKGSRLGLSVLKEKNSNKQNDTNYLLSLSIPLDIPLYRRNDIASLKGRVIDTKDHQPIANVIINIAGQYAISDTQGYYTFRSLAAGSYSINTDLSKTSKVNYLLANSLQTIKLPANQTTIHTISLSQGTGLKGNVIKYIGAGKTIIENNNDKLLPSGGIEGLLVTLISTDNQQTVHKTITLEEGYFSFSGIKSGIWQIQVSDPKQQIQGFRISKATRLIKLTTGKSQQINFKAIPFIKTIKKIGPRKGFSVSSE